MQTQLSFLAFDLLSTQNQSLLEQPLTKRLGVSYPMTILWIRPRPRTVILMARS